MRITVSRKLYALSLGGVVTSAVIGSIGISAFHDSEAALKSVVMATPALRNHMEGDMMHDAIRSDVLAAMLAASPEDAASAKESLDEHASNFRRLLAENRELQLSGDVGAELTKAAPLLESYIDAAEGVVSLASTERARAESLMPKFTESFEHLEVELGTISDLIEKTASDAQSAAEATMARARALIILAVTLMSVGALAAAFFIVRSITRPLAACRELLGRMAAGDFTGRLTVRSKDEIADVAISCNETATRMGELIAQVTRSAREVAGAAQEIDEAMEESTASAKEQSQGVNQIAAAIEELSASAIEVARKAETASGRATESGSVAGEGVSVVNETIDQMQSISSVVIRTSELVTELGKRGVEIGELVSVIDDIADQTNLLALNAAIEAARAGEHGRGFAVVADEVRKLADRTQKSTAEIGESIQAIRHETQRSVEEMATGRAQVQTGVERATQAGETLQRIVRAASDVTENIRSIAAGAGEQRAASDQISATIQEIASISSSSAEGTARTRRIAELLASQSRELVEAVSRFKIA
ncbi:MAG: methyl-accepting chemotaxis protein [Phycisphaerales bacterium]|nr:MAG: methyl-accepting chemotaxis protein [Phycisphaerales bacterium]